MAIYNDKDDIAIKFVLSIIIFTELYIGYCFTEYFFRHVKWYNKISDYVRFILPVWLIDITIYGIYFLLGTSLYIYYWNISESIAITSIYIDIVTLIFIINLALSKLWPFVFFKLKLTFIALTINILIIITAIIILTIFGFNNEWAAFGCIIPYIIWIFYIFYINFAWFIIERRKYIK